MNFDSIAGLFRDPPPEWAFEVSSAGIAASRTRPPATVHFAGLAEGVIAPSPVRENIANRTALEDAVKRLVPASGRRTAALILPDNALRLSVLEFDSIPEKTEERMSLVKFRLKKTLPFDVEQAALSFHVQAGNRMLVGVARAETIAEYEAPFRAAALEPGFVTSSSLAVLELLPMTGSYLVANRNSGVLAVLVVVNGVVTLSRSLELSHEGVDPLDEISSDLYATRIFAEDQSGSKPDRLYLAGFGSDSPSAAARFSRDLDVEVSTITDEYPGLAGYLRSVSPRSVGRAA